MENKKYIFKVFKKSKTPFSYVLYDILKIFGKKKSLFVYFFESAQFFHN